MNVCKKVFLCITVAGVSLLAWITNLLELLRDVIVLVLELPQRVLFATAAFLCVFYSVACFLSVDGILSALGLAAIGCLALIIAYKVLSFVCTFLSTLLGGALDSCDFERITFFFATVMHKAIFRYKDLFDSDDELTKKDRFALFCVPWIFDKLNRIFKRVSSVIVIFTYIVFGIAGTYFSYKWFLTDIGNYEGWEIFISIAMAVVAVIGMIYFGHCIAQVLKSVAEAPRLMNDVFSAHADYFRNAESNFYGKKDNYSSNYSQNRGKDDYGFVNECDEPSDNPFYAVLSAATTSDELKKIYHDLAKKLHPDVCKDYSVEESTAQMSLLNSCYESLCKRFK